VALGPYPALSIADARRKAEELKRQSMLGIAPPEIEAAETAPTIAQFWDEVYWPHVQLHHKNKIGIRSAYTIHVGKKFGTLRMDAITKLMVRDWTNSLVRRGFKPSTINRLLLVLGHMFTMAHGLDVPGVPHRSAIGIRLLKVRLTHERHLSPEEAKRLNHALRHSTNPMLRFIVAFLLFTGARKREALDARWCDIDLEARTWVIPVTKTGGPRTVYLSDGALRLLDALRHDPVHDPRLPFVFPNPKTGKPFACIFYAWNAARRQAGLDEFRIHDLRHSFASILVNNGVPLYDVQKLLGHASIKTTQRYAHLNAAKLFRSVAVADQAYRGALEG
jgi:integrase